MENKRIIITGVSGQDGSYMADYLLENTEHQIFGVVRRASKPDYSNLRAALKSHRFRLLTADLSDSQSIENVVREANPDYFINLGAQSFVGSSWQVPEQTFDVCAIGVLRCLEAIRKFSPNCRFYSAGSSEEMGDIQYCPQDINHPIRPRSPYGAAKAAARHITKVYRDSYSLYAVHSILYNHESERRGEEFVTRKISKGVARIHKSIKNNKDFSPIELGNLDAKRDWSHAKDFVKGIWLILNQENFNGHLQSELEDAEFHYIHDGQNARSETWRTSFLSGKIKEYILSSNETHSIRDFVEKAFAALGVKGIWHGQKESEQFSITRDTLDKFNLRSSVLVKVNPEFYRPAEVSLLHGDSSLARKELGWQPEISFDKLVELMVLSDIDEAQKSQE